MSGVLHADHEKYIHKGPAVPALPASCSRLGALLILHDIIVISSGEYTIPDPYTLSTPIQVLDVFRMVNGTAWEGAVQTVKYGVYLGMWTNWSRGRVLGATLTLSREDGNYLLSFTAFFIGFVSTRFWRIMCFILHNLFSTSTPRDALYHQQQAILRNSYSADSGLLVFVQLA
jgi:hypothetical protein